MHAARVLSSGAAAAAASFSQSLRLLHSWHCLAFSLLLLAPCTLCLQRHSCPSDIDAARANSLWRAWSWRTMAGGSPCCFHGLPSRSGVGLKSPRSILQRLTAGGVTCSAGCSVLVQWLGGGQYCNHGSHDEPQLRGCTAPHLDLPPCWPCQVGPVQQLLAGLPKSQRAQRQHHRALQRGTQLVRQLRGLPGQLLSTNLMI